MKYRIIYYSVLLFIQCRLAGIATAELGPSWRKNSSEMVAVLKSEPNKQALLDLANQLGSVDQYNSGTAEEMRLIQEVASTLISVPGHAGYIADEIKREQEKVKQYPTITGPRVSYDRIRSRYFTILAHLPSSETISVLGEFLSDDIDTPQPLKTPGSDWGNNPRANSFYSSSAISMIGLRDQPAARGSYDKSPEEHLAKTRAWWEEIKSGRRTFSFVGQNVEYRFKPDSTWETIAIVNPPDDAPKYTTATKKPEPFQSGTGAAKSNLSLWAWILGGVAALLAGLAWRRMRISTAH